MKHELSLNHISFAYYGPGGETTALSDVTFSVSKGEFVAIVGPSGCGKSTLLSLIARLNQPTAGEILLDGRPLSETSDFIGYMLQRDHLLEWRSTAKNVALGLEINHALTPENMIRLQKMLGDYSLASFADAKPQELSGGMRQRAALIRTLLLDPDILLLDEPFSALDYQTRLAVSEDIWNIIRQEQKTAILITHDISEAISMADRVIVLSNLPATVRRILTLDKELSVLPPIEARNSPLFSTYFSEIWKELTA